MKTEETYDALNDVEIKLKAMYQADPERYNRHPFQEEDVKKMLIAAFSKSGPGSERDWEMASANFDAVVQEHTFIPADMDISFVRHMRYIPAVWHEHTFFELLCVLKGSCHNIFHDREVIMGPGDICLHSPGTVHAVSAFSDDTVLINILLRKSTFEQAFFSLLHGNSILAGFFRRAFYRTDEIPYLLFHTRDDQRLAELILAAQAEADTDHRYKRQMVNTLIYQLLILMMENHEADMEVPDTHLNAKNTDLMQILNYINENFRSLTLKDLSAHFNYSERQMQRIITEATGISFIQNIQNQKMQRAASLLSTTALPVSAVCEQAGFPSPNHFRKIFERRYGMTPSEYRNRCSTDQKKLRSG